MEYRSLGPSGLKVSAIGLGANNFGSRCSEEDSVRVIDQSIDLGINFIDTANIYSKTMSEQIIGRGLKGKRDKVILATKFGMPLGDGPNQSGGSRGHIIDAVDASLKRLQTDYIDLYQFHQPDPETPIEETMYALHDLVQQGKVRYIGSSNFSSWRIAEANWTAKSCNLTQFVTEQPYYNLLKREVERELVPFCQAKGVGVIPYFPLESGFLTGKYRRGEAVPEGTRMSKVPAWQRVLTDKNFSILDRLETFAAKRDHTVTELAMAWLLAVPSVCSVIAGATRPEQVVANAKASQWHLTPEDKQAIDEISPLEE